MRPTLPRLGQRQALPARLAALLTALAATACDGDAAPPAAAASGVDAAGADTSAADAGAVLDVDAAEAADVGGSAKARFTCSYTNPFSQGAECKAYTGAAWTEASAAANCAAVMPGTKGAFAVAEQCALAAGLGSCVANPADGSGYTLISGGSDAGQCDLAKTGCTVFAKGQFSVGPTCGGAGGGDGGGDGGGGGGGVLTATYGVVPFVQPYVDCRAPKAGEPAGKGPDGKVCTPVLISGCTEAGRRFDDYASCQDVMTNRPYWAAPPAKVTAKDDPRLKDAAYMAEVAWARSQIEASACVCCHTNRLAPNGGSNWVIDGEGIWLDGLKDSGLAMMAGLADSTALGAFDAKDNNGFDRTVLGVPTTDVPRMQKLLLGEWQRRGLGPDDAKQVPPFGGPLVEQLAFVPGPCGAGEGVDAQGLVQWSGGAARYVYVLSATAASPGVPPNLDVPNGTLWLVDVASDKPAMASGIPYGVASAAQRQRVPAAGAAAPALAKGQSYYLVALQDIGMPLTRCLFTAP